MGLYLAVFDEDEELEGVEVGSYADFGLFRDSVATHLESGSAGSRFPVLMLHSDCDGSWSPAESLLLQEELEAIREEFQRLPPLEPKPGSWQESVARSLGMKPKNRYESFFDVDGEPLVDRLITAARVSVRAKRDILFQ